MSFHMISPKRYQGAEIGACIFLRFSSIPLRVLVHNRASDVAVGRNTRVQNHGASDEVGYLTYGPEAVNVMFHVVNDRT
jgi:hypothetical protein